MDQVVEEIIKKNDSFEAQKKYLKRQNEVSELMPQVVGAEFDYKKI